MKCLKVQEFHDRDATTVLATMEVFLQHKPTIEYVNHTHTHTVFENIHYITVVLFYYEEVEEVETQSKE